MNLDRFWAALTGKTKIETTKELDSFYAQLSDFRAEIKADHTRIESKLDKQAETQRQQADRINQIFSDMSIDEPDGDS